MVDLENIRKIVTSRELTHEQKLMQLAKAAENSLDVLNIPPRTRHFFETGAINDLFEGGAPYRPRYILPDYEKFVKNGSAFLRVDPPKDLDELLNALMILYRHVPSITNFPVYLGSLDTLIDPFLDGLSDEEICKKLRLFLNYHHRLLLPRQPRPQGHEGRTADPQGGEGARQHGAEHDHQIRSGRHARRLHGGGH